MANISKIKISGTSYSIKDENACKVVELTQAEYDELPTTAKTSNSLFVITDAEAGDLSNYYTKTETDGLLDTKLDVTAYTPTDLSNYYTKAETSGATEISTALESKADTATTYTKTETDNAITAATSTKQDTLVSGTNIKTINGETLLGEGNITIQGGSGGGGKAIEAGRGISVTTGDTADTVSFNLPISADTDGSVNKLIIGSGNTIGSDTEKNIIIGDDNTTFGQGSGRYYTGATIIGYNNKVGLIGMQSDKNDWSFVIGRRNEINGGNSFIIGTDNNFNRLFGKKINYLSVLGHHNQTSSLQTDEQGIGQWVIGAYNEVSKQGETAIGIYNLTKKDDTTSGNTIFTIGNGTADNARHNVFEIRQNGDIYITKDGQDVKLQDQLGGGGSSYTAGDGIDINNDVISVTGKVDTSAITTSISSSSTDSQVPSAKAVYDMVGNINTILESI